MVFILFERQTFVVSVAFIGQKFIGYFQRYSVFVTSPINIFKCHSFYFLGGFLGLNINSYEVFLC